MIRCAHQSLDNIPLEWAKVQLKDVTQIHAGGKFKLTKINNYQSSGIPAYSASGQDGYVSIREYSQTGVVLSAIGARCGKCFYAQGDWTTLANTQVMFGNTDKYNNRFLWYVVNDERFWHRSGTAQPFIKPTDIQNAWVPCPSILEQQAIVQFLDTMSKPIQTHTTLKNALNTLKKGLLQQFFAGTLFSTNSRRMRMKEIAAIRMGKTIISTSLSEHGIPVYSAETQNKPWGFIQNPKTRFPRGTIVLSARGSIGFPRLPQEDEFISTQTTIAIQPKEVLPRYLHLWLQTIDYKRLTSTQAVPMLTVGDMKEIFVRVPDRQEQLRIISLFDVIDSKIHAHTQSILALKKLIKGYTKRLLYGELRIPKQQS